jgi:hypothetical protein
MVPTDFGEERVFILYIFPYLHLGLPFPLSVLFSSIKSNPQHYQVYYNVSNYFAQKFIFKNFCFLFNHMHEFLHFFFSGVYT